MMLEYIGETDVAANIRKAVDAVLLENQCLTPDLGGKATTEEYRDAVIAIYTKKQPLGNLSEGLFCYLDFDEEKDGMRLSTYRLKSVQMQSDKTHITAYLA